MAALTATYALPLSSESAWVAGTPDPRGNAIAANPILAAVLCSGLVGSAWTARHRPHLIGLAGQGTERP